MKVKVTNTMLKAIREISGCYMKANLVKFSPDEYAVKVDYDLFRNEQDFDYKTGMFKAIRIDYAPELYAVPRYITTRDLVQAFRGSDKTYTGFLQAVKEYCMV